MRLPEAAPGTWPARVLDTAQEGSVAYFYATGSYPALAMLVDAGHPRTHGRHTFFPVLRPLQRAGLLAIDLPAAIPPFVTVARRSDGAPFGTNAYTFLYYPLEDFGVIGAIVYAAVIGVGCGWVFGWARRDRRSALRLLVAGQVSTALALTFFVNKFNSTHFWYVLLWTSAPFLWAAWRARRGGPARA
jgi:oligosaccharide repeat unit polymerase